MCVFHELWRSSCGNPTERGKSKTGLLAARQFVSPPQGALMICRKRGASGQEKDSSSSDSRESIRTIRANRVIRANRKFEWFVRIVLTRYKNRGFNCEWFARIDSRESGCESPVPLRKILFIKKTLHLTFFTVDWREYGPLCVCPTLCIFQGKK